MNKFSKRSVVICAGILMAILSVSCAKKEGANVTAGPVWKPAGNEGDLAGTIIFNGEVPARRKIETGSDLACQQMGDSFIDDVVAEGGKLRNVFVYVKSGLPQVTFEIPASEVALEQKGCKFAPRVLGIQTGQILKIINSDPTDHNVHPVPKINREWNQSQLSGQEPIKRKFVREEIMVPVKCNKHPWMLAWIGVLSHPFYAVSGADGSFAIKGLPPGDYEVEAWHEKYGAKTIRVTVREKAETRADFTFDTTTSKNENREIREIHEKKAL